MSEGRQHEVFYADRAWHGTATVEENVAVARDTYRIRLVCPEVAGRVLPGQFVMLRLAETNDPLLGRPLAMYDVVAGDDGKPYGLDIVYLAVGKMTRRLVHMQPSDSLDLWGPLGNGFSPGFSPGFPPPTTEHLIMVAGGIGQTPFLTLAKECLGRQTYGDPPRQMPTVGKATLCYGGRSREYLAGVEDFRRSGVDVRLSTDDGSVGHHGLVTDLIAQSVKESPLPCRIVCCGPEPMMEATAAIARELGLPCQVSLESPMACGVGICFSCVAKIRDDKGDWDYRRTCVEGPVFDAARVEF